MRARPQKPILRNKANLFTSPRTLDDSKPSSAIDPFKEPSKEPYDII